ncbi:hypothetical protein V6N11_026010 [Hibiscus sabdariffa]|uniref:Uncharacterized protein n=1 Tax=Hibiscus sabdariffa TaxID=183260 RepID=A0ABR2SUR2_9ROSI
MGDGGVEQWKWGVVELGDAGNSVKGVVEVVRVAEPVGVGERSRRAGCSMVVKAWLSAVMGAGAMWWLFGSGEWDGCRLGGDARWGLVMGPVGAGSGGCEWFDGRLGEGGAWVFDGGLWWWTHGSMVMMKCDGSWGMARWMLLLDLLLEITRRKRDGTLVSFINSAVISSKKTSLIYNLKLV